MRKALPILALTALLGGCSVFEGKKTVDPIFENTPTGVDAKVLVDQLPEDLPGDNDNARHSSERRIADDLRPPR